MKPERMMDLNGEDKSVLDVTIDYAGKTVWVNVDGICMLRACNIGTFILDDRRKGGEEESHGDVRP